MTSAPGSRTLEQLTGDVWPDPGPEATSLVRQATEARRIPLDNLSPDELRMLLLQQVDVDHVLPVAVAQLVRNLDLEGMYPGDVLEAAMRLPTDVWERHPMEYAALRSMLEQLPQDADEDLLEQEQ